MAKRYQFQFKPAQGVKDLYSSYIDAEPIDMDWSDSWNSAGGDFKWEAYNASYCEECGAVVGGPSGEHEHRDLDDDSDCDGGVYLDEPMMNYAYPINTRRVGGPEAAALELHDLPLCVVVMSNGIEYLALTGGGMDLSWEICAGYMRLGYLPPVHFSGLPKMAGMGLTARNRWIISGMRRALRIRVQRAQGDLMRMTDLAKWMRDQR